MHILIDEPRYRRLLSVARERGVSVGAVIRDAIDSALPAAPSKRLAAARRVLSADPMPVPDPDDLKAELEEIRAGRR